LGVGAGQQLLAATRDQGADLLVMGGYGQMPWRQSLFGGATREIVGVSLLPVLLSHWRGTWFRGPEHDLEGIVAEAEGKGAVRH
jgi:hypothetical protein